MIFMAQNKNKKDTVNIEIECRENNSDMEQPEKVSPVWLVLVLISGISTFWSFSMLAEQENRDLISNLFIFSFFFFLLFLYILISKVHNYYMKFGSNYDSSRDCFDD